MKDLLNSDISAEKRQIFVSKQEDICVETGRYLWANIMQIVWCPPHICQAIWSCQMQEKGMGRTNMFFASILFLVRKHMFGKIVQVFGQKKNRGQ